MIIRETKITECWCNQCGCGQMQQIFQKSFDEKKHLSEYVGEKFICAECGFENKIEDFISIIPHEFLIMSQNDASKIKSNDDLKRFADAP